MRLIAYPLFTWYLIRKEYTNLFFIIPLLAGSAVETCHSIETHLQLAVAPDVAPLTLAEIVRRRFRCLAISNLVTHTVAAAQVFVAVVDCESKREFG